MYRLFIAFAMLFLFQSTLAQPGRRFSVEDKKAIKYYLEAESTFELGLIPEAQDLIAKALEREPKFGEAFILKAQMAQDEGRELEAIEDLKNALNSSVRNFYNMAFFIGELEMKQHLYQEADGHFRTFLEQAPDNHPNRNRAHVGLESCAFAMDALQNPVAFDPINMGSGVNTKDPEYFPCLTADGKMLLFTRLVKDGRAFTGKQEDFYISSQAEGKWQQAISIPDINTERNEGAPTLSPDGQLLIFTACESIDGWREYQGKGSCDLFFSQRAGDRWTIPENMGKVNSYKWESQPSFASDGKTLYFVRGVSTANGINSQDIYYSVFEEGVWSTPEKIPGLVNTKMEEESVMIHPDGKTLYFASNGHPGMGGMDLFMSKKQDDGSWGKPVNLGYPINTGGDENSILVGADGKLALFASDREGGYGGLDLYSFELPDHVHAEKVTYVAGVVMDAKSYKYLEAKFELIDLETEEVVVESYSNFRDGSFLVCLPPNRSYALNVSKKGYLFYSDHFELKVQNDEPYELEVRLQKVREGASMILENVFFDTDSYTLKPQSKVELNKLVGFMGTNPEVRIEIGGHTDDVGSEADNEVLSDKRASAVVEYLKGQGVEPNRLKAKGYGEKQPKASNSTEAGRAKNRRTEFKIIG